MSRPHALVYADVDFNIIDGSSIWAISVADALASAGASVTVLAKAALNDYRLVLPLLDRPNVRLVFPDSNELPIPAKRLQPEAAATVLGALEKSEPFDIIVVRGAALASTMADKGVGAGRTWCYLTDIPQSVAAMTPERLADVTRIVSWASVLLCQTEQLRGFLEQMVPEACGKTALLPPIIPDDEVLESRPVAPADGDRLRLVYAGKHAPQWRTLEMCDLPRDLRKLGVEAELVMIGDKIHIDPDDDTYRDRMQRALIDSDGVRWQGGLSRAEALDAMGAADVGLAWRAADLDDSLELSTKLLEFGSRGVPAVLNRTPMHEELLGSDYPLFVDSYDSVVDTLVRLAKGPDVRKTATQRLVDAATGYTRAAAAARLARLLSVHQRARTPVGWTGGDSTVLVAGYDLKFLRPLTHQIGLSPDTRIVTDAWKGHDRHDAAASTELLRDADVIVCEWMLGNAVWYSHNKRPGQRLVIRCHRVEVETDYPTKVDIGAVDALIFVGPEIAQRAVSAFGLPEDKVVILPNHVDTLALERTKRPGSEYALGMIGALPDRKRLDLALDLIRSLRRSDERYRLYVKSTAPWELPWMWRKEDDRKYFERLLSDIANDPILADGVVFDRSGPDVAEWLRKIGWVVSLSDDESFHLAAAEGMASGAVPLIRNWPGAKEIYGSTWVHDDVPAMVDFVTGVMADEKHAEFGERAKAEIQRFDVHEVADSFAAVLAGRDPMTARFWTSLEGNR